MLCYWLLGWKTTASCHNSQFKSRKKGWLLADIFTPSTLGLHSTPLINNWVGFKQKRGAHKSFIDPFLLLFSQSSLDVPFFLLWPRCTESKRNNRNFRSMKCKQIAHGIIIAGFIILVSVLNVTNLSKTKLQSPFISFGFITSSLYLVKVPVNHYFSCTNIFCYDKSTKDAV